MSSSQVTPEAHTRLNVLKVAKRNRQGPYASVPAYETSSLDGESSDPEKGRFTPETPNYSSDRTPSSTSSCATPPHATSDLRKPMLSGRPSRRLKSTTCYKLPNRTVRYLCLALISTILILIFSLIRLSFVSSRRLELGLLRRPLPPPLWGDFPFLERYYGGIRSLVLRTHNDPEYPRAADEDPSPAATPPAAATPRSDDFPHSETFNPYPEYASKEYTSRYGLMQDCIAHTNLSKLLPGMRAYRGVPSGLPDAVMGSAEVMGLTNDVCFERYGRYGPYGYGYSLAKGGTGTGLHGDRQGVEDIWGSEGEVDYRGIDWSQLQQRCVRLNKQRFDQSTRQSEMHSFQSLQAKRDAPAASNVTATPAEPVSFKNETSSAPKLHGSTSSDSSDPPSGKETIPRTAFIIRTWWDYKYSVEDIVFLRALITEMSLLSGGEYSVHLLIHVKDVNAQIWASEEVYQDVLHQSLPEEFWGLGTLWSERQMGLVYGGLHESFYRDLPVHGVYRSTFMPVQWFAQQHPEYDFFWHWEMDARYTGHFYHLFDRMHKWTQSQPRKGLWERSGRFYIPSVHGTWEDFKQMVRVQTEMGTESANNMWSGLGAGKGRGKATAKTRQGDKPIWGPERPLLEKLYANNDVEPPTTYEKDRYQWGVGEDADLITLNPLFDPDGTEWILADDITGYNTTRGMPPRRASIVTTSRLSRRLLNTMHHETSIMRHTAFSEMWPATCALHHGLKAVYAPHPVYVDRKWPLDYLAATFNGGRNGAAGGARTSVFGGREHNFLGMTWYYNAGFAPNLWKRWFGFRVDGNGGEEEEVAKEGRMCLPGIILHPVKDVRLVVEGNEGNNELAADEAEEHT
ncbi:MAG: hypothetical protein M1817_004153 [Caeruleum heppii]|nr:MAG: hypothetical protein M1817_004153 [Caeruleum heppii]